MSPGTRPSRRYAGRQRRHRRRCGQRCSRRRVRPRRQIRSRKCRRARTSSSIPPSIRRWARSGAAALPPPIYFRQATASDLGAMAARAGAKHLVLTHLIPAPGAAVHIVWKVPGGGVSEADYSALGKGIGLFRRRHGGARSGARSTGERQDRRGRRIRRAIAQKAKSRRRTRRRRNSSILGGDRGWLVRRRLQFDRTQQEGRAHGRPCPRPAGQIVVAIAAALFVARRARGVPGRAGFVWAACGLPARAPDGRDALPLGAFRAPPVRFGTLRALGRASRAGRSRRAGRSERSERLRRRAAGSPSTPGSDLIAGCGDERLH